MPGMPIREDAVGFNSAERALGARDHADDSAGSAREPLDEEVRRVFNYAVTMLKSLASGANVILFGRFTMNTSGPSAQVRSSG